VSLCASVCLCMQARQHRRRPHVRAPRVGRALVAPPYADPALSLAPPAPTPTSRMATPVPRGGSTRTLRLHCRAAARSGHWYWRSADATHMTYQPAVMRPLLTANSRRQERGASDGAQESLVRKRKALCSFVRKILRNNLPQHQIIPHLVSSTH
jgi:hypothetical protein